MGRRRLIGIFQLLGLGLGTIVTDVQQSGMECVLKEVLKREVKASVSEAAPYFRSENMPSVPIPVVSVKGMSLNISLEKNATATYSSGDHETAEWINKRSADTFQICNTVH